MHLGLTPSQAQHVKNTGHVSQEIVQISAGTDCYLMKDVQIQISTHLFITKIVHYCFKERAPPRALTGAVW